MGRFSIHDFSTIPAPPTTEFSFYKVCCVPVIRRNGTLSVFDASKISVAITKAFLAVEGTGASESRRIHEAVESLTRQIVDTLTRRADPTRADPYRRHPGPGRARAYALRRAQDRPRVCSLPQRSRLGERTARREREDTAAPTQPPLNVRLKDVAPSRLDEVAPAPGRRQPPVKGSTVSPSTLSWRKSAVISMTGFCFRNFGLSQTMAARALVEQEPNYAYVSARLLLNNLRDRGS